MLVFENKETGERVVVNDDTATSPDMKKHEYEYLFENEEVALYIEITDLCNSVLILRKDTNETKIVLVSDTTAVRLLNTAAEIKTLVGGNIQDLKELI